MNTSHYALIALGGGTGSVLRAWLCQKLATTMQTFPLGVLTVNLLGSLAIGILAGWLSLRPETPESIRVFLILGLLGGFTTFSSFSFDTLVLIRAGLYGAVLINCTLQVVGGLLLAGVGFYVVRSLLS